MGSRARSTWAVGAGISERCSALASVPSTGTPDLLERIIRARTVRLLSRVLVGDGRPCCARHCRRLPDPDVRFPLGVGARLMSAGDAFGLAISILVLVYLVYALVRGEHL